MLPFGFLECLKLGLCSSLGHLQLQLVVSWGTMTVSMQRKDGVYIEQGHRVIWFPEYLTDS